MHQFGDGNDRNSHIDLALCSPDILENLQRSAATPFARDNEAGIEDQSHDGGFHGLRLRMMSPRSAANSESRTGDSPVSSSCFLANAIHSEIDRPGGTAGRTTATGGPPPSLSMITSAPARTRASTEPKSLSASASETCITMWLMRRLSPYLFPSRHSLARSMLMTSSAVMTPVSAPSSSITARVSRLYLSKSSATVSDRSEERRVGKEGRVRSDSY